MRTTTNEKRYSYDVPTFEQWIYQQACIATRTAIKARYNKSGQYFLLQLLNSYTNDNTARNSTRTAQHIADIEQQQKQLQQEQANYTHLSKECRKRIKDITTAQTDRKLLTEQLKIYRTQITRIQAQRAKNRTQIELLHKQAMTNYTDLADIVQTVALDIINLQAQPADIPDTVLQKFNADSIDQLTDTQHTQAQSIANYKHAVSTAGKAISRLASPEALNGYHTKLTPIEKSIYKDSDTFVTMYGGCGKDYHIPCTAKRTRLSDCYMTCEYRNSNRQHGWYIVMHYRTINAYQYIDSLIQYDDNGKAHNPIEHIKTYNPFINNITDIELIEQMVKKADLSKREHLWIDKYCRCARFTSDKSLCIKYASREINLYDKNIISTFTSRLYKKLRKAYNTKIQLINEYEREISRKPKAYKPTPTAEYDALQWTTHTAHTDYNPIIDWITPEQAQQAQTDRQTAYNRIYDNSRITYTAQQTKKAIADYQRHIKNLRKEYDTAVDSLTTALQAYSAKVAEIHAYNLHTIPTDTTQYTQYRQAQRTVQNKKQLLDKAIADFNTFKTKA